MFDLEDQIATVLVDGAYEKDYLNTPLLEFRLRNESTRYVIKDDDASGFDLPAYRSYGIEEVWWVLALINDVIDPMSDYFVGQVIVIPAQGDVWDIAKRGKVARSV